MVDGDRWMPSKMANPTVDGRKLRLPYGKNGTWQVQWQMETHTEMRVAQCSGE
jgi:hypothetical protein